MKKNRVFGGVLLIAGTAIGAGMIALPITTGVGGFIPASILLVAIWLYLTATAFLFLEATLWFERDVNIVTIAEHTLGAAGKVISWLIYLFLLYSLTTAYLSGCGTLFIDSMRTLTHDPLPSWLGPTPFLLLFGLCVYMGTKPVDYFNRVLMIGLVLTFVAMAFISVPVVEPQYLAHQSWSMIWPSIAIMVTSFGFHIIIPSLSYYLGYRLDLLKKTLIYGSIIPLVVYLLWEVMVLGVIPAQGEASLTTLMQSPNPEVALISLINSHILKINIGEILRFFSYFAILTSFLGVSLSLSDFLADGFKIKKDAKGRFFITVLTFLPPLFFSLLFPNVFVSALKYAAIFVAILLGIFPAVMIWSGRYRLKLKSKYQVFGGKILLSAVIIISLLVIAIDLADHFMH